MTGIELLLLAVVLGDSETHDELREIKARLPIAPIPLTYQEQFKQQREQQQLDRQAEKSALESEAWRIWEADKKANAKQTEKLLALGYGAF